VRKHSGGVCRDAVKNSLTVFVEWHKQVDTVIAATDRIADTAQIILLHLSCGAKRHLDRFSRFCCVHRCARQTRRPRFYVTSSVAVARIHLHATHAMRANNTRAMHAHFTAVNCVDETAIIALHCGVEHVRQSTSRRSIGSCAVGYSWRPVVGDSVLWKDELISSCLHAWTSA